MINWFWYCIMHVRHVPIDIIHILSYGSARFGQEIEQSHLAMNNKRTDKIKMKWSLLLVVGLSNEMRWITTKLFGRPFPMVNCNHFGESARERERKSTKAKSETSGKGQSHVALYYQLVLHFDITNHTVFCTQDPGHRSNAHVNEYKERRRIQIDRNSDNINLPKILYAYIRWIFGRRSTVNDGYLHMLLIFFYSIFIVNLEQYLTLKITLRPSRMPRILCHRICHV